MKVRALIAVASLIALLAWIMIASRVSDVLVAHASMVWSAVVRGIASSAVCIGAVAASLPLWRGAEQSARSGSVGGASLLRVGTLLSFTLAILYGVLEIGRSASSVFMTLLPATDDLTQGTFKWEAEDARLSYEGLITVSFPERLRAQLNSHADARELAIKSDGGFVDAARAGALVLNASNTGISVGETCYSACAVLFASTDKRYITTESEIGFHAPYKRDATGVFRYSQSVGVLRALFMDAGFPETFVAESFGTKATEMKGIKGKELVDLKVAVPLSESPGFGDRVVRKLAGVREVFNAYPKIAATYDKGSSLVAAIQSSAVAQRDGAKVSDHLQRLDYVAQSGFLFTDSAGAAEISDQFAQAVLRYIFNIGQVFPVKTVDDIKIVEDLALAQIRLHSPKIVESLDYANDEDLSKLFGYVVGTVQGGITEKNYVCRHLVLGGAYGGYFREAAHNWSWRLQYMNPEKDFDDLEGVLDFSKSIGQAHRIARKLLADARPSGRSDKFPAGKEPPAFTFARLQWSEDVHCLRVGLELDNKPFKRDPDFSYLYLRTFFEDAAPKVALRKV